MHFILLAVGIFLAIVGVVLIRYGVPLDEYGNSPLLMAGMVALVGGVLSCGLFFVVRALSRIAERLEIQPLLAAPISDTGRPPVRAVVEPPPVRPEPAAPPAATPLPEVAITAEPPRVEPRLEPAAPPPPPSPRTEPVVLPTAQPRIDVVAPPPQGKSLLGWLGGKQRAPAAARKPPAPDEPAPVDLGPLAQTPQQPAQSRVSPPPAGNGAAPPVPPPALPDAAVYKSGVIDGMAYTLYTDGSIEAQLPQGAIRFASVEALQSYLVGR